LVEEFAKAFRANARIEETLLEKAETDPMPDHVPLSEKSPRVVAIQLAKRARDIAFRPRDPNLRKPPSVVIAASALELGPVQSRLIDELLALAGSMEERINSATRQGLKLEVRNPAYRPDVFTDRWPEDLEAQKIYAVDLRRLRSALYRLRNDALSPERAKSELEQLFGETAAAYAVEAFLERRQKEASSGNMAFGTRGRVLTGAAAVSSVASRARASTFEGGDSLPE
jgi:hypothetical protein